MSRIQVVPTPSERAFGVEIEQDGAAVRGSMLADKRVVGFDDRPAVGALGVLVDEILGYSIIGSLAEGAWTVSTEIWIDVVSPMPGDGSVLHGIANIAVPGSFATGKVVDEGGRVVAECRERGREIADPPDFGAADPGSDGPFRPDAGPGIAGLLGLREQGDVLALEVTPEWENPRGVLHGGISLAASEAAAAWSRVCSGSELATCSLHIVHTRPVPSGVDLVLRPTTRHAGRSLWVTDVEALADGAVCAISRVTAQA